MSATRFHGILPPMITPFLADGAVDYSGFIANIQAWNCYPLTGYLVCGSNSETAYLEEAEKLRLVELTARHAAPGRHLMAGAGLETPQATVRLTNLCADLGMHSALVLTPSYYDASMSSAALIDFYTRVAEQSRLPILIYNVPKFTHVNIKADAVAALAKHENIIGIKDSTGDIQQLAQFIRVTQGEDFSILVGTAGAWYPALALGLAGGVHAAANCSPAAVIAVQEAFLSGDTARARDLYQATCPLNTAVTATYGIAGLKLACELNGFRGGRVRCPLQELDAAARQAVERINQEANQRFAALGVSV